MPELLGANGAGDVETGQVAAVAAAQPGPLVGKLGFTVAHGRETTGTVTPRPYRPRR